ncbi:amidase [Mycolicibacterium stellerae]|uniref:amidase n=1 Tax=Mycolicibacterium stellerae TaxID=2358193 RepID=UPI000F0B5052|nr:amidase [Mycolicibacterium stellerae]
MDVNEYAVLDAVELARLVRSRQVSAPEVHDAARSAIAAVNPTINAFSNGPWEEPLAYEDTGPLAGVPFALKDDPGCHAAGIRYRYGSLLTGRGITYGHDTHLVRRFRAAGLGAVGITAASEFSLGPDTVTRVHGVTRNPWDPARSAGGSSGGSAALVAAGALPVAHGSDAGGSIRFPSSWNGVVGLKPSRGRVSPGPDRQDGMGFALSQEFVLTRTVRDCAALLDVAAGPMPGDAVVVRPPQRPWSQEVGAAQGPLRVALCTDAFSGTTDPEVRRVAEDVAQTLERLGHHVDVAAPALNWERFMDALIPMAGVGSYTLIEAMATVAGTTPSANTLEHATLMAYDYGSAVGVQEVLGFAGAVNVIAQAFGEFFCDWDLFVSPTAQVTAEPIGFMERIGPNVGFAEWLHAMLERLGSFTSLFNVTGAPAISLPLGTSATGMPVGCQVAASMCEEALLLRVAAQLEEALPWAQRRPVIHAAS